MKRNKFLKTLRKRLSFLSQEEIEKEMAYYVASFEKTDKSDEEVIKEFGSIDEIVNKIRMSHNDSGSSKIQIFEGFQGFYEALLAIGEIFRKSDNQKRSKLIMDLVFLIIITCVIKIPFIFVRDLGDSFIGTFFKGNINILAIWGLLIEISYVVAALSFFIKTLKKWVRNLD